MLFGALLLPLYGFAVNLFWRGDFSRLLGASVVIFFAVSQLWGALASMRGSTCRGSLEVPSSWRAAS